MKLKQQITLIIVCSLLIPVLIISSVSIYKIKSKATADIETYRQQEFDKLQLYLKHITDIAYGIIETRHATFQDSMKNLSHQYREQDLSAMKEQWLTELSLIRFDKGEGYFWVTDNRLPYPMMLMHAENKALKGKDLSDEKYNVTKNSNRNIYQVRAELCNNYGDGFVEYIMRKPGTTEVENKISYSRLYKPLGWIISSGFYTDQIEKAVVEKKEALRKQIQEIIYFILAIALVILALGFTVSLYFSKQLTNAILHIKEKLRSLASGQMVERIETSRKDEVGEMTQSLNGLVEGITMYTSFAKQIGQGNLETSFKTLSEDDVLGNELLVMRANLKRAQDEKNIRDWVNEGLAVLGDVLRKNNSDTEALSKEVLHTLINYLKVNQGTLFILEEGKGPEDIYLRQVATFAYNKHKHISTTVRIGEGLVGQCVAEKATIHLREIPHNYISITSGLGEALPDTLIIVPLIFNQIVYGVIEMASFRKLQQYEISFIEKVAESIASTISSVQTNEKTRRLLEHSQQMSEELKAQEEELRQNQEELQATQEQMLRRQKEIELENEMLKSKVQELISSNISTAA